MLTYSQIMFNVVNSIEIYSLFLCRREILTNSDALSSYSGILSNLNDLADIKTLREDAWRAMILDATPIITSLLDTDAYKLHMQ